MTVRGEEGIGEEPEEVIYPTLRASTPDIDPRHVLHGCQLVYVSYLVHDTTLSHRVVNRI